MKTQTLHDKVGANIGSKWVEEFAGKVVESIADVLLSVFDWTRSVDSLMNRWLYSQTPALAYAVVGETKRGDQLRQYYQYSTCRS